MKRLIDIKRFRFYLWVGAGFLGVLMLSDLASHSETFWQKAIDDAWGVTYVIILNYYFFEHVLP